MKIGYLINYLYKKKGRAGRTGQSQTGECYVIAHEKDMKQVNILFEGTSGIGHKKFEEKFHF